MITAFKVSQNGRRHSLQSHPDAMHATRRGHLTRNGVEMIGGDHHVKFQSRNLHASRRPRGTCLARQYSSSNLGRPARVKERLA